MDLEELEKAQKWFGENMDTVRINAEAGGKAIEENIRRVAANIPIQMAEEVMAAREKTEKEKKKEEEQKAKEASKKAWRHDLTVALVGAIVSGLISKLVAILLG